MKYLINKNCIGCGLCASICPEVFEMTDEGFAKAPETEISGDALDTAEEAQSSCPVNAIESED